MKKVNSVLVNQSSHNRDYVKNASKVHRYRLFLASFYNDGSKRCRECTPVKTRSEVWMFVVDFCNSATQALYVSLSKSFFSCYNSWPIYQRHKSDLSYFYEQLSPYFDLNEFNFYPVAHISVKNNYARFLFFATKVKVD